jgi:hypothetical protein
MTHRGTHVFKQSIAYALFELWMYVCDPLASAKTLRDRSLPYQICEIARKEIFS